MAQLFVPGLDDAVEARLRARAKRNGRSLGAEARAILEEAVREEPLRPGLSEDRAAMQAILKGVADREAPASKVAAKRSLTNGKSFGALMHERFKKTGLTEEEARQFQRGIDRINRR
jgi:plasmid stability protein